AVVVGAVLVLRRRPLVSARPIDASGLTSGVYLLTSDECDTCIRARNELVRRGVPHTELSWQKNPDVFERLRVDAEALEDVGVLLPAQLGVRHSPPDEFVAGPNARVALVGGEEIDATREPRRIDGAGRHQGAPPQDEHRPDDHGGNDEYDDETGGHPSASGSPASPANPLLVPVVPVTTTSPAASMAPPTLREEIGTSTRVSGGTSTEVIGSPVAACNSATTSTSPGLKTWTMESPSRPAPESLHDGEGAGTPGTTALTPSPLNRRAAATGL